VGKPSFTTLQSIVALFAGLTSIGGAAYSAVGYLRDRPSAPGQIVTIVRDGASERPVRGALVEILTPANDLVTTVAQDDAGVARHAIVAGTYRVRVMHPDFVESTREVQVQPDGTAEMRVALARRPPTPAPVVTVRSTPVEQRTPAPRQPAPSRQTPGQAFDRGVTVARRVLGRFGF
jgi:hypothetical protein